MPRWLVTIYEVYTRKYEVVGKDEEEALANVDEEDELPVSEFQHEEREPKIVCISEED